MNTINTQADTKTREAYTPSTQKNGYNGFLNVAAIALTIIVGLGVVAKLIDYLINYFKSDKNSIRTGNVVMQGVVVSTTKDGTMYKCERVFRFQSDSRVTMTVNIDPKKLVVFNPNEEIKNKVGNDVAGLVVSNAGYCEVTRIQNDYIINVFYKKRKNEEQRRQREFRNLRGSIWTEKIDNKWHKSKDTTTHKTLDGIVGIFKKYVPNSPYL